MLEQLHMGAKWCDCHSMVTTCQITAKFVLQLPRWHTAGFECGIKDVIRFQIGEPALISHKFG